MNPLRLPAWLIKLVKFARSLSKRKFIGGSMAPMDRLENRQMAGFLAAPTPAGVSMGGAQWFTQHEIQRPAAVLSAANPVADRQAHGAMTDISRAAADVRRGGGAGGGGSHRAMESDSEPAANRSRAA